MVTFGNSKSCTGNSVVCGPTKTDGMRMHETKSKIEETNRRAKNSENINRGRKCNASAEKAYFVSEIKQLERSQNSSQFSNAKVTK